VDRGAVHHFHAGRDDPFGDHLRHASPGLLRIGEADENCARCLGLGQDPHGDFGDHTQQAFGADHNAEKIEPAGIEMPPAQPHDLSVHQHQFDTQHIVGGQPVFEAVHPARILRDIAADRAGDLAGGVGRIIEATALHRLRDRQIGDARLDHGDAVFMVHFKNALELAEPEQDRIGQRRARRPKAKCPNRAARL